MLMRNMLWAFARMKVTHPHPDRLFKPWARFRSRSWHAPAALLVLGFGACAPAPVDSRRVSSVPVSRNPAILPEVLPDPAERVNRGVWAFNRGVLEGVIQPVGRVYQFIVPRPVRKSIANAGRNLAFPGRVVNETLQGRWKDAGDESLRFICNSTAGVGGLFDVATRWNIPKNQANFAQTFQGWGWRPQNYVMLPFLGPSDDSSVFGVAMEEACKPWNYYTPLRRVSYVVRGNELTDTGDELVRFIRSSGDSYADTRIAWSYASKLDAPDWKLNGPQDISTLQTLSVATMQLDDPDFLKHGREMSVRIPSTGCMMPFDCWLQKKPAPLVYVAPGLGSHRLSMSTLAIAESLYQNGFSVVATTSVFHPEFMERASSAALPAHPPTDGRDVLVMLTEIDRKLEKTYPGRFGSRALVGCSMGAYQALYLAAREKKEDPGLLKFDRYVGINTPVDLHHGIACLDRFHDAPLAWPAGQRQALVNNTVHKVAALAKTPPTDGTIPPFSAIESQFLIGLSFRITLRDAIFSSQSRHNLGVLQTPISQWKREPAYDEILGISYRDYVERFAMPYYLSKGYSLADFKHYSTLKAFGGGLKSSGKVRVVTNRNDFLLAPGDLGWLRSTLGSSNVKVFPDGGHLGNLASPEIQAAVTGFLDDLK